MSPSHSVAFIEEPEAHWPYLSNFRGTAGERHFENVKVHNLMPSALAYRIILVRRSFAR